LQVDLLHQHELGWPAVADRALRNLAFLDDAFDSTTGRFRNFRAIDGSWSDDPGSEDSHGRAILALGEVIAGAPDAALVDAATSLFDRALPAARGLTALRAQASVVLGCAASMSAAPDPVTAAAFRVMAAQLAGRFDAPIPAWPWPESRLTYENALPARALIVAGEALGSEEMTQAGLAVLDWLLEIQTATEGHLSPIGNGWWPRDGDRSSFDQQPIEATSLLLAAEAAYRATGEDRYRVAMERAYGWFLGRNDLGLAVADARSGAGGDGLTPGGVNTNQGAESTLMWLIAAEHIRSLRTARRETAAAPPSQVLVGTAR
jgi:hypothetical protein